MSIGTAHSLALTLSGAKFVRVAAPSYFTGLVLTPDTVSKTQYCIRYNDSITGKTMMRITYYSSSEPVSVSDEEDELYLVQE